MSNDTNELVRQFRQSADEVGKLAINLVDVNSDRTRANDGAPVSDKGVMAAFYEPVKAMRQSLEMLRNCPEAEAFAWLFEEIDAKAKAGEPLYAMLKNGNSSSDIA